jgi:hypothetical protein
MCEGMTPAIKSRQLIMRSVSGPHRMSTVKGGKRILMRNRPRRLRTILNGGRGGQIGFRVELMVSCYEMVLLREEGEINMPCNAPTSLSHESRRKRSQSIHRGSYDILSQMVILSVWWLCA